MTRCGHEAAPFGSGDARGGAAKVVGPALTHFDEYQRRALARDEIDFPEATAIIAFGNDQSLAAQERGGT
jgi:hypothetical protein